MTNRAVAVECAEIALLVHFKFSLGTGVVVEFLFLAYRNLQVFTIVN